MDKYIGKRYSRLVVVKFSHSKYYHKYYICKCDCGIEKTISICKLNSGATKSCGCWNREKNKTHGMSSMPEYTVWVGMIQRCTNPNNDEYARYGARGITVCKDWQQSFKKFIDHIGPRPSAEFSVERIDNDKGYQPGNVRWATHHEQNRNMRSNQWITYKGQTKILTDWAESIGLSSCTISNLAAKHNKSVQDIVIEKLEKQNATRSKRQAD